MPRDPTQSLSLIEMPQRTTSLLICSTRSRLFTLGRASERAVLLSTSSNQGKMTYEFMTALNVRRLTSAHLGRPDDAARVAPRHSTGEPHRGTVQAWSTSLRLVTCTSLGHATSRFERGLSHTITARLGNRSGLANHLASHEPFLLHVMFGYERT